MTPQPPPGSDEQRMPETSSYRIAEGPIIHPNFPPLKSRSGGPSIVTLPATSTESHRTQCRLLLAYLTRVEEPTYLAAVLVMTTSDCVSRVEGPAASPTTRVGPPGRMTGY